jgi:hypothetical protein
MRAFVVAQYGKDGIYATDLPMKSLTVLKPGGLAIGVAGPPDAGFAKQVGAPKPFELVMSFLSRTVRRAARKLGVYYSFFFMRARRPPRGARPSTRRAISARSSINLRLRPDAQALAPTSERRSRPEGRRHTRLKLFANWQGAPTNESK